jgi:hypothetical protein
MLLPCYTGERNLLIAHFRKSPTLGAVLGRAWRDSFVRLTVFHCYGKSRGVLGRHLDPVVLRAWDAVLFQGVVPPG